MRRTPLIAGIEPVNVALRSVASGPEEHAVTFARKGGCCA
jgi:hypothetical protein